MEIELQYMQLISQMGLLGAFIAGMLFLYRLRHNDLDHLGQQLTKLQDKIDEMIKELIRIRTLLENK